MMKMTDFDFMQITGRSVQTMIYFKIISEERIGRRSYKQLTGQDLDGYKYSGVGVIDCDEVLRAIRVFRIGSGIFSEDLSQWMETEDGQIIVVDSELDLVQQPDFSEDDFSPEDFETTI